MAKSIRFALLGALSLPVVTGLALAQNGTQPPKFAYVDSRIILQRAPGSAAIQAQITKERADAQASVAKMQDSLRVMYGGYMKVQGTVTAAAKEMREKGARARRANV